MFFKRIILHIQLPELADLFCQRHAREQIFHALGDGLRRIFVNIFLPIFVQINPAGVINGISFRCRNDECSEKADKKRGELHG